MDRASSSLPLPILPVLRAHLSDVSVASTELDVTSLPELTEDDRGGDDGLDLLLGHGAGGRMNGGCDGGYDDLRDLTEPSGTMGTHQSLSRRGPILDAAAIPDDCKQPRRSSSPNEQLVSSRCNV